MRMAITTDYQMNQLAFYDYPRVDCKHYNRETSQAFKFAQRVF